MLLALSSDVLEASGTFKWLLALLTSWHFEKSFDRLLTLLSDISEASGAFEWLLVLLNYF